MKPPDRTFTRRRSRNFSLACYFAISRSSLRHQVLRSCAGLRGASCGGRNVVGGGLVALVAVLAALAWGRRQALQTAWLFATLGMVLTGFAFPWAGVLLAFVLNALRP